jgi:lysophospholipase L1-like esterase
VKSNDSVIHLKTLVNVLNAGITGQVASGLLEEIDNLITSYPSITGKQSTDSDEWNMIGILIGANDICGV